MEFAISLTKDKKLSLLVNGICLAITLAMFFLGTAIEPLSTIFDPEEKGGVIAAKLILAVCGIVIYMVGHEAVHGIFMHHFCPEVKVNYGFNGMYAFAGSKAFYNKRAYLIIALAPVVVWGFILLLVNIMVPVSWWWVVYVIQIQNIAGAAGDYYCFWKFMHLPDTLLVQDSGTEMNVYLPERKLPFLPDLPRGYEKNTKGKEEDVLKKHGLD